MAWPSFLRRRESLAERVDIGQRGTPDRPDSTVAVSEALHNTTVTNCVTFLAKTIADLGFYGHPVLESRRGPNQHQTQYEFIHGIVSDLLIYGNAFVRVIRGANGTVISLIPFSPRDLTVNTDRLGDPIYQTDRWAGEILPANEVIHFRDSPENSLLSPSRTSSGYYRIAALSAADRQIDRVFKNGIHFTWVVTNEKSITPEQAKELSKGLTDTYGRQGEGQGTVLVLGGGNQITRQNASTPADQDLRETRQDLIREIAALFGVPPFVAGGTGDTRYNNVTARISVLHRETISPIAKNIAAKFSQALRTDVNYDLHGLLSGDIATATAVGTQAAGGPYLTPNEVRVRQGLEPLDNPAYNELRSTGPTGPQTREGEFPTDDGDMTTMPPEE